MLNNRFAGDALKKIDTLCEAGIEMNGQVVCCKGINDGAELDRTISDLTKYIPHMQSLSVVPVGLTKYREGLYPLEPFEKADAQAVIAIIEKWQQYCMEHFGIHFVHASDEWYLTAELPLPEEERYDGYLQLENGVGMIRLLLTEFRDALEAYRQDIAHGAKQPSEGQVTLATGRLAAPFLEQLAGEFMQEFPGRRIDVTAIRNDFFGERITVAGLVTAQDLAAQLKDRELGEYLCIPDNMLRSGEKIFLDDRTVAEVEKALQVPVVIVKSSGQNLLDAMAGKVSCDADVSA
jgi:putative radical SAM enzyme (TIGR03279 family)